MKTPTITQDMSLHYALTRREWEAALRFFNIRLKQLRKAARRKRRELFWLKIKRWWNRPGTCTDFLQ